MQDLMEQLLGYARGMWQRRWIGLAVAWLAAIIGAMVAFRLPDKYEATARVYVDTQSLLRPLMQGMAMAPDANQQVGILSRTLLSRPNVEKIIRKSDLDTATRASMDDLAESVGKTLQFSRAPGGDNLFLISYRYDDRNKAREVVQAALSTFIEQSLGEHRKDSETAKKFVEQQIRDYEGRLQEAEARVQAFRLKHLGVLGTSDGTYLAQMAEVGDQIKEARISLRIAEQTRDGIAKQLQEQTNVPDAPQAADINVAVPEIDSRIDALKRQLDDMLRKYTEEHPDVMGAKRVIATLERERAQVIEARRKASVPGAKGPSVGDVVGQQLQMAMNEAESNVTAARARLAEYESRYNALRAAAENVPKIEMEFSQLNRDYGIQKRQYEALVSRRETATLSGKLEDAGVAEFRIIDPPRVSPNPVAPNRFMLLVGAIAISLAAGLAGSFLASQVMPTFHDGRALRDLGRPILGMVSIFPTAALLKRRRRATALFAGGMAGLMVTYGAAFAFALMNLPRIA